MHCDIKKAKEILSDGGYTCILYRDGREYTSTQRGVKPLIDFLQSGKDFKGFFAADKTVGAGAAHLYVLLGVKGIWANIISQAAQKVLEDNGIPVFFEKQVPFIINRSGDGVCPIEDSVKNIFDSNKAFLAIKQKLFELSQKE